MPSAIKTSLGLNKWAGSEVLKTQDFIDDNQITDDLIVALQEDKIDKSLITAANDLIFGASVGVPVKKTLAESKTILGVDAASETATGVVERATAAEVQTGTDAVRYVSPAGIQAIAGTTTPVAVGTAAVGTSKYFARQDHVHAAPDASETVKGIVELATAAEVQTGTDAARAVTPAGLAATLGSNLILKRSCKAATTANITLSAPQTIDGVSVVAGDRVLVKNQTTASANGIYVVAAGAWARATDSDTAAEFANAMVAIDQGTTQGGWLFDTDFKSTDTLGTTLVTFNAIADSGKKLSHFAATTSAELAAVISDETGSGALVFATSPTFTGAPLVPTAVVGTSTTQAASTDFVNSEIANDAILKSLITAQDDLIFGASAGVPVKKTLAEAKIILGVTAADILAEVKTVDGKNSGLFADWTDKLAYVDRRLTNPTPQAFVDNQSTGKTVSLFNGTDIGLTDESFAVDTTIPWADTSAGVHQIATGAVGRKQYIRTSLSATTWGAWQQVITDNPVVTTITTGFASGWSGTITVRKNHNNLYQVTLDLLKSTDAASYINIYTLAVGLRPLLIIVQPLHMLNTTSDPVIGNDSYVSISSDGTVAIYSNGTIANARRVSATLMYFGI